MTDRGREFTVHLKRKAALKGKEEFRLQLVAFEKSIYDIGNPDFIRSEVQKLKSLADNAMQGFIEGHPAPSLTPSQTGCLQGRRGRQD